MARFGIVIVVGLAALSIFSVTVASDVGWPGTPNTWGGCAANCIRCQYTAQNGLATGSPPDPSSIFGIKPATTYQYRADSDSRPDLHSIVVGLFRE